VAALATVADLEDRLGRSLTDVETTQAVALLDDASATVRVYTGRPFARVTETVRLPVVNGYVNLPQRPVVSVTSVVDVYGAVVTHEWFAGSHLNLASLTSESWWSPGSSYVDVTYTHGDLAVPAAILGVVCGIAKRALEVPAASSGLTGETIGGYSYSIGPVAASGGAGVLNAEKAILDRYRRVAGVVRTGGR